MTIKELYEWAKKNDCENYDVIIQYRDEYRCVSYDALEEYYLTLDRENQQIKM